MLRVVVRVRKVDHCGYCSDNNCEADADLVTLTMPAPPDIPTQFGQMLTLEQLQLLTPPQFNEGCPELELNSGGSYYCQACDSPWPDVGGRHDGDIQIVCAMGI